MLRRAVCTQPFPTLYDCTFPQSPLVILFFSFSCVAPVFSRAYETQTHRDTLVCGREKKEEDGEEERERDKGGIRVVHIFLKRSCLEIHLSEIPRLPRASHLSFLSFRLDLNADPRRRLRVCMCLCVCVQVSAYNGPGHPFFDDERENRDDIARSL